MARDLANEIYSKIIEDYIYNYEKPDGMILEQEIATRYSVSKTPAREALIRLVNDGILIKYPCKGYVFRLLNHEELVEIARTRICLEMGAYEAFLPTVSRETLREISRENIVSLEATNIELMHYNNDFHLRLASLCSNEFLIRQLKYIFTLTMRSNIAQFSNPQVVRMLVPLFMESHQKILDALMEGSLENAKQALHDDIFD